jgi:hypothetical protein
MMPKSNIYILRAFFIKNKIASIGNNGVKEL